MTAIPNAATAIDSDRTVGERKADVSDLITAVTELIGGAAATELTIAAGAVTPTAANHTIDTEADAATDDLNSINTTNQPDGRFLLVRSADNARTVVVKHAAGGGGQIFLKGAADFSLTATSLSLFLERRGADWHEVLRHYGTETGQPASTTALAGLVEAATQVETDAGTADKFPDSARVAAGYTAQGKHMIPLTAGAFKSAVTNGAESSDIEEATNNNNFAGWAFDDATEEHVHVMLPMPKAWNGGTFTMQADWRGAAAGDVVWGFKAVVHDVGASMDQAFGTERTVTDTAAANTREQTGESAAITAAGTPAGGKLLEIVISRKAAAGGDTLVGDAVLLGASLFITTNAKNDT